MKSRDARGYILPSDQPDFLTATKFVNTLIKKGITVLQASKPFRVEEKSHPAGSYIIKTAQAFRPHIVDMFEPQDYPDDIPYPGGTIFIPAKKSTDHKIKKLADEVGLNFDTAETKPKVKAFQLKLPRIGLWNRYGGSMSSGWVRWLLEQFEFDFEVVYPAELDAGNLIRKYDVLIFVGGAIPAKKQDASSRRRSSSIPDPKTIPAEYRKMLGAVTAEKTVRERQPTSYGKVFYSRLHPSGPDPA